MGEIWGVTRFKVAVKGLEELEEVPPRLQGNEIRG